MKDLISTTNTSEAEKLIITTFVNMDLLDDPNDDCQLDFEHGQWWVTNLRTGAQWSVVDASGGRSLHGLDFERVTEGEEV